MRKECARIISKGALSLLTFMGDGFQSGALPELSSVSLKGSLIHWSRGSSGKIDSLKRIESQFGI